MKPTDLDMENSRRRADHQVRQWQPAIFSRQESLRQLWLADKSWGFHFDYDEESKKWVCEKKRGAARRDARTHRLERIGEKLDFDEISR